MAGAGTVLKARGVACAPSGHSCLRFVIVLLLGIPSAHSEQIYFTKTDFDILLYHTELVKLKQTGQISTSLQLRAVVHYADIVQLDPLTMDIPGSKEPDKHGNRIYEFSAYGKKPGHTDVTFEVTPTGHFNAASLFLRITVMKSYPLRVISYIMGWGYFLAWSVSFYPQIYINFKRKSVVGLNPDFLALNIVGFTMYSLFNCGLYFSKYIQDQYFARHPRGLNPVLLNDVFFSLHATFAVLLTITQCFIYERGNQRVSTAVRCIIGVFGLVVLVSSSVCLAGKLEWLDFLYYCSYIKLSTTLIKYVPQAIMNYRRKSTVGWSIGNIILDFVGGFLSILQMALNAHNYDDWISFLGDFTKFGLGLFSLLFDIFFMLQHYVFYREARYVQLPEHKSRVPKSRTKVNRRRHYLEGV